MNPENPQMNPDQSAAALAMATHISEGLMPKSPPPQLEEEMPMGDTEELVETEQVVEEPGVPENPEEPEEPEEETGEPEEERDLGKEFDEFKGEVKGILETKLDDLTKTLRDALK